MQHLAPAPQTTSHRNDNPMTHEASATRLEPSLGGPRSTLINRNIIVSGHRTSVRLEPEMWGALLDISAREGKSVHELCTLVADRKKPDCSLTAAIRVFTMAYYKAAATEDGHQRAGHGQR